MRGEYFPEHLKRAKKIEIQNFRQGELSIEEYYTRFRELANYNSEIRMSESAMASKF